MVMITMSCKTTDQQNNPDSFGKDTKKQSISTLVIDKSFTADNYTNEFEITAISLNDSLMKITTSYTGCKDDVVTLIFNGNYMKSYPMKAEFYLKRTPGKSGCDKKNVETFIFDISPVKSGNGKTIIVSVQGYAEKLTYNFK